MAPQNTVHGGRTRTGGPVNAAPSTLDGTSTTRRLLPGMKALLVAFALLTAIAVGALYVLAENTAETFAWTISPALTAAFLGAGYAAGFVLVVLCMRDPVWVDSRAAVLTIFAFVVLTLVATLLHVNRLHFDDDFGDLGAVAKVAAWFWFAVYVIVPVAMAVLLVLQERAPGDDPPATHPIPGVLRTVLAVESALLLVGGVLMYADPTTASTVWPWPLLPFTGRVVAAWLLAFGLATALAAVHGDLARLRTAAIAYTVFGVLVLAAVARFSDTPDWDHPSSWIFVGTALAVVATGAAGWRLAPRPERHARG
jgi:hypothetical protein